MNKLHLQNNKEINNLSSSSKLSPFTSRKNTYEKFVSEMAKSDFANSITRYLAEYNLLKDLSSKISTEEERIYVEEHMNKITEQLKEYGIEF